MDDNRASSIFRIIAIKKDDLRALWKAAKVEICIAGVYALGVGATVHLLRSTDPRMLVVGTVFTMLMGLDSLIFVREALLTYNLKKNSSKKIPSEPVPGSC
jgi:hypothetical protein